jgi:dienelactone hydrolase
VARKPGNRFITFLPCVFLFLIQECSYAQKPALSLFSYKNFEQANLHSISNDGKYVIYGIGSQDSEYRFIIQATDNSWAKKLRGASQPQFVTGGFVVFSKRDSIGILLAGSDDISYVANVSSFQVAPENGSIAFVKKGTKVLYTLNLSNGQQIALEPVENYLYSNDGSTMLFSTTDSGMDGRLFKVHWRDMRNEAESVIYKGILLPYGFAFNSNHSRAVFRVKTVGVAAENKILYYKTGRDSAVVWVVENEMKENYGIGFDVRVAQLELSDDGDKIYFNVRSIVANTPVADLKKTSVDVWSYKDKRLQSQQLAELPGNKTKSYLAVVNREKRIIPLESENESVIRNSQNGIRGLSKYILTIRYHGGDVSERNWNKDAQPSIFLISLSNGSRTLIKEHQVPQDLTANILLSPNEDFVLYYDMELKNYYSYSIKTKVIRNITRQIDVPMYNEQHDVPSLPRANGIASWIGDHHALVYDNYDIWKIDLSGSEPPQNVTAGFGRKNGIVLRVLNAGQDNFTPLPVLIKGDTVQLVAFDKNTKQNGFYSLFLDQQPKLSLLSMSPHLYYYPFSSYEIMSYKPFKAKAAKAYVLTRMNAMDAPNIFFTKDLSNFTQLSFASGHKKYNWFTSELFHWMLSNGKNIAGILYKPENFDSSKQYPVIIYMYEKMSYGLHNFLSPDLSNGSLKIPYFVSNGYVVFVPDIYYKIGDPAQSVYDCVMPAIKQLEKFNWVDRSKIGLQGISFGAYEVIQLLTTSQKFAAAAESAGTVNFISSYGSFYSGGISNQFQYEMNQNRIGYTLWERPEEYFRNSPILGANKITTPLLVMHNKLDDAVPFSQGVELFTALRRMKKTAWLLQYDGEGHGVSKIENQADYSIRLFWFFNHYLKNAPAPFWMTQGIPAKLKQVVTGYDLDPSGNCSKDCKVCKMWNEKMKKDSLSTIKEIKEKYSIDK